MERVCEKCGSQIKVGNNFCTSCGNAVSPGKSFGQAVAIVGSGQGFHNNTDSISNAMPATNGQAAYAEQARFSAGSMTARYCVNCGKPIKEGEKFCTTCGKAAASYIPAQKGAAPPCIPVPARASIPSRKMKKSEKITLAVVSIIIAALVLYFLVSATDWNSASSIVNAVGAVFTLMLPVLIVILIVRAIRKKRLRWIAVVLAGCFVLLVVSTSLRQPLMTPEEKAAYEAEQAEIEARIAQERAEEEAAEQAAAEQAQKEKAAAAEEKRIKDLRSDLIDKNGKIIASEQDICDLIHAFDQECAISKVLFPPEDGSPFIWNSFYYFPVDVLPHYDEELKEYIPDYDEFTISATCLIFSENQIVPEYYMDLINGNIYYCCYYDSDDFTSGGVSVATLLAYPSVIDYFSLIEACKVKISDCATMDPKEAKRVVSEYTFLISLATQCLNNH